MPDYDSRASERKRSLVEIGLLFYREKELKKWQRAWKVRLIEEKNPEWKDLYESICK